ncbi:ATP-binding cassette subfamily C exporter for protease/lipase [Sphaerotilus hippei]|uniref:ATP-binding cassette subfamily C exporter for protease/lipase n=1 Tax=Sphaerotilus hippei TaxID=744406 RepID=A0A318GWK2_9BURK|nr:type I secretion system permease/ATPase [Sphaerotilus hippei]PXW94004.1 ATP-binding cassette subfamily C exporter for protease/lipase [Sphaerotilus hippei]
MTSPAPVRRHGELKQALLALRREGLRIGAVSLLANLLMLAPTLYMLQVYDRVMVSQNQLTLLAVSAITLGLFGLLAVAEWLRSRLLVGVSERLDRQLAERLFVASLDERLSPQAGEPPRTFSDLTQLRQFLTGPGVFAFFDAPWTPVYLGVLCLLHPWLGAGALLFALLQALLAWSGQRRLSAPATRAGESAATAAGFLRAKFVHADALRSMGMTGPLWQRWLGLHRAELDDGNHLHHQQHLQTSLSKFLRYTQQSFSLGLGAWLVIEGQLSVGSMIAANVLMTRTLAPIDQLTGSWRATLGARDAYRRLAGLLERHPVPSQEAAQAPALRGELSLHGLSAWADGRATPVLRDIELTLPAGSVTVVMGPSGSGKSTLARVLVGIWADVRGQLMLDGTELDAQRRRSVGEHIGYLPQEIELFDASVAENIARLGEVVPDQVIAAARATGLHDMILRLPKGYDTNLNEAAHMLSGGQRQRIALARAVHGQPALVVLDEPNAHLDEAGEHALTRLIHELKQRGTTVVLISHRRAVLAAADTVVLLEQGEIRSVTPRHEFIFPVRPVKPVTPAPTSGGLALQPAT